MESISDIPSELIHDFMKDRWTLRYLLRHKKDHPYISFFNNRYSLAYTLHEYYGFPDVSHLGFPTVLSDLSSYKNTLKKFNDSVSEDISRVQRRNYKLYEEWKTTVKALSDAKVDPEKRKKLEDRRDELVSKFPEFDEETYRKNQSIDEYPWIKNFLKATWILYELVNSDQNVFQYPKLLREADLSIFWIQLLEMPLNYGNSMETKTGNALIEKLTNDPETRQRIIIDGYYKDPERIPHMYYVCHSEPHIRDIVQQFDEPFRKETEGCSIRYVVLNEFDRKFATQEARTKFFINIGLAEDIISEYYSIDDEDVPRYAYQSIKRNAYRQAYSRNLYEYEEEKYGRDPPRKIRDPMLCRNSPSPDPPSSSDSEEPPILNCRRTRPIRRPHAPLAISEMYLRIPRCRSGYAAYSHTPYVGSEERRRIRFKTWYGVKRTDNGDGTYTLERNSKTYVCQNLDPDTKRQLELKSKKDILIQRIRNYIYIPDYFADKLIKIHGRKKRFCKITIGELESLPVCERERILSKLPFESFSKEDIVISRIPQLRISDKAVIHAFCIQNFKDRCDNSALLSL